MPVCITPVCITIGRSCGKLEMSRDDARHPSPDTAALRSDGVMPQIADAPYRPAKNAR